MGDISIGGGNTHRTALATDAIFNDPACFGVARPVVEKFLEAWALYPTRRGGNPRRMALRAWIARVRAKEATPEQLYLATVNYRKYCVGAQAEGTPYVLHGATFYGPNERWRDFLEASTETEDDMAREIRETWLRGGNAS